jgi:hypothetical protein
LAVEELRLACDAELPIDQAKVDDT